MDRNAKENKQPGETDSSDQPYSFAVQQARARVHLRRIVRFLIDPVQWMAFIRAVLRNDRLIIGGLALLVGLATGVGVGLFREGIGLVQTVFYGDGDEYLASIAVTIPWWQVLMAPVIGGVLVGLFYRYLCPGGQPEGVPQVIEASSLRGGRMPLRRGIAVAFGALLSIGSGASVGREGPAVHLGATLGSVLTEFFKLNPRMGRTLLGCGAAAAVAASFNAPIAGALFATEVIVGHYALSAFAPIVVASVVGTLVSREWFGEQPAFTLPPMHLESLWEFPAFFGLGIVAAIAALIFMRALIQSGKLARKFSVVTKTPTWIRPGVAGLVLGLMAIWFPELLGVGYEATDEALKHAYDLDFLLILIPLKILATAVCLGFGFGGGVFSPALCLGALVGAAYGILATAVFPDLSSGSGAYALIGAGATAAAVLGAPISTALIIFEMTSDYALTIAVMVAVVTSATICSQVTGHASFFHRILALQGIDVVGAPDRALLRTIKVSSLPLKFCGSVAESAGPKDILAALARCHAPMVPVVNETGGLVGILDFAEVDMDTMRASLGSSSDQPKPVDEDGDTIAGPRRQTQSEETVSDPTDATSDEETAEDQARLRRFKRLTAGRLSRRPSGMVVASDSLEQAIEVLEAGDDDRIIVVDDVETRRPRGWVLKSDIMTAYNKAILAARAQDQR